MAKNAIHTERLVLRAMDMADVADVTHLLGDYEVSKWLTAVPHPFRSADAQEFIGEIAGDWDRVVELDGALVGVIGIDDGLGYWLGRPFWGHGLMGEAAKAMVAAWFEAGNQTLTSGYFLGNGASAAILDRLGFVKGAVVKKHSLARKAEVDLQQMSLRRADWQARHA